MRKYNLNPRSCVCVCTSTSKGAGSASWREGVSLGSSPLSSLRHTKVADHQHLLRATWAIIATKPASASHTTSVYVELSDALTPSYSPRPFNLRALGEQETSTNPLLSHPRQTESHQLPLDTRWREYEASRQELFQLLDGPLWLRSFS